jgi:hypothetical protein
MADQLNHAASIRTQKRWGCYRRWQARLHDHRDHRTYVADIDRRPKLVLTASCLTEDKAKALATDLIIGALQDVRQKRFIRERKDALKWFNFRETTAFGYGWCLHYSNLNPNVIRRVINKLTGEVR